MSENGDDAFYVGYLPLPQRHRRFLRRLLPAMLLGACGVALAIGAAQKDPGQGRWEQDKQISLEGAISVNPYALLHTREGDTSRAVLLVEEGKFGAAARVAPMDGKYVKVRGTLLHRDGRNMLEIASALDAVEVVPDHEAHVPASISLGGRTLHGEVIDPKCYIGAMKPGGGKTHKACAELCLAGGIPPMLAVWEGGHEVYYLLENADGSAANQRVSHLAGESADLNGEVERQGDLLVLKLK